MTQPAGKSLLDDIFRQPPGGNGVEGAVSPDFFELCLKVVYYIIDHIPYLNTWFINSYNSSMDKMPPPDMSKHDVLCAYPCPSYLTARQVDHLRTKIAERYGALMERTVNAPDYAVCYSRLHALSEHGESRGILLQKVAAFYHGRRPVHLGAPGIEKRPTLSPDFVNVCITILPHLNLDTLYLHGPIEEKDRKKLKGIIISIRSLASLHLEVEGNAAVYFTAEAIDIIGKKQTITTFNLTLMGKRRVLEGKTPIDWNPLNNHPTCRFNYSNVDAPKDFISQQLTFQ